MRPGPCGRWTDLAPPIGRGSHFVLSPCGLGQVVFFKSKGITDKMTSTKYSFWMKYFFWISPFIHRVLHSPHMRGEVHVQLMHRPHPPCEGVTPSCNSIFRSFCCKARCTCSLTLFFVHFADVDLNDFPSHD